MSYKTCRWSNEEETQLLEYVNDEVSWEDISRELQRSIPACKKRVKKLEIEWIEKINENKSFSDEKIDRMVTEVTEFMENNKSLFYAGGETNMELWTPERDLDLLIHFYELSIDEAKARYGRSYGQIASRLEYLVDSTEPEHIMQVMKATDKIRVKKLHLAALTEESWRVKRKVSKIRKLQTKIEKLTQSVLKNLRGGNNEQEQ